MPRPIGIPNQRQTDTVEKALGAIVTKLRITKGLSQATLAEKLGYSLSYVSKLERGQMNATLRVLFDLADSLEIKPEELVKKVRRTVDTAQAKTRK